MESQDKNQQKMNLQINSGRRDDDTLSLNLSAIPIMDPAQKGPIKKSGRDTRFAPIIEMEATYTDSQSSSFRKYNANKKP